MGVPLFPPRLDGNHMRPFYEGLAEGILRLTACSQCGERYWYPPDILPCHPHAAIEWRPASSQGSVYTFTTVHRSLLPGDDGSATPYTVLLVEPDDVPGARVPSLLVAETGVEARCGMRVSLKPVPAGDFMIAGFEPAE
jgi:uncharacterized protein